MEEENKVNAPTENVEEQASAKGGYEPHGSAPLPVLGIAKTLPTVDVRLKDVAVVADSIAETMMD